MNVTSLFKKEEKIGTVVKVDEGFFQKDKGLLGDINAKGGDKQVSIFTKEGREFIERENIVGLCTERFYENITIEGLSGYELHEGQTLKIGNTIHEITYIGKKCFPECSLLQSNKQCPLSKEVIFTKVIRSGVIKVGDIVEF